MRLNFRIKLFLHFIVIIAITSIPIVLICYNFIYNSLKNDLFSNAQAQMKQIDNNISGKFNQIRENDKLLSVSDDITGSDKSISAIYDIDGDKKYSKQIPGIESNICNHFEKYSETHPDTTYVYIGTKWGGYIQWPDGVSKSDFDPRKRPWYSQAMSSPDNVVISEPYTSAVDDSGNVIITASTTVKNKYDEIIGAVGIDVSLDKLSDVIKNIKIGDTGYIFLYLKDGTMLAHPNTSLNFKNISKLNQFGYSLTKSGNISGKSIDDYSNLIDKIDGDFETVIDGKTVLVSVYTSPNTGWKMASIIQKSELTNKAKEVGYAIMLVVVCVLVLVTFINLIFTKIITKPIKELTPLMLAAGNGNLTVHADIKTNDEFGEFSKSFNLMINKLNLNEKKINYMIYYDHLTKLANRTLLMKRLNEQLDLLKCESVEGAVFYIDLDNFKNINDTMGHSYGDKLLIHLAYKLREFVDKKDTICRLGGDEFILLCTSIKEADVEIYAKKLLNLFNENLVIDNRQMYISASMGVTFYPKDGTDSNTILKNADAAMYKAKELGKNRFFVFDPKIYLNLKRKTTIERILRNAIKNNELSIFYQPQYDPRTNEIFGFEALLRLNSRKLGFISPAEFIPIAEECGYITELGKWVINESCMQVVKWLNEGYKFKSISINISSVDLQQADFLENIKEILRNTSIDNNIVELEITETVLMQSFDSSINILQKLMDIGVRIALDDFGTGYSSLSYLRRIPISTLKIDKSFIDNIIYDKKEESIINSIIKMAHSMDLKVVAEGVETKEQLETLNEKKCDYIQGYYFSKPLPATDIEKLLKAGKSEI